MPSEPPDLLARLTSAATAAILNQRPAIECPVGFVKSITLELELNRDGKILDSGCHVERRGVHHPRATRP